MVWHMLLCCCLLVHCCMPRRPSHAGVLLRLGMEPNIGLLRGLPLTGMMDGMNAGLRTTRRKLMLNCAWLRCKPVPAWRHSGLLRCYPRITLHPMTVHPMTVRPMIGYTMIGRPVIGRQWGQKGMGRFVRH